MFVSKEELYEMIDCLLEEDMKTVYDFVQFLHAKHDIKPDYWMEVDKLDSDNESLSEEKLTQLNSGEGCVTGDKAGHEPGIETDLP